MVLHAALARRLRLCVSAEILEEYQEALRRPKFGIDPLHVEAALEMIRARAKLIAPRFHLRVTADLDDNNFLECAEAVGADYLVTGNRRHFPAQWQRTAVVNARTLIELLASEFR